MRVEQLSESEGSPSHPRGHMFGAICLIWEISAKMVLVEDGEVLGSRQLDMGNSG